MKKIKPLHLIVMGIILLVSPPFLFHYRMSGYMWADILTMVWLILFVPYVVLCTLKLVALFKRVQLKPEN